MAPVWQTLGSSGWRFWEASQALIAFPAPEGRAAEHGELRDARGSARSQAAWGGAALMRAHTFLPRNVRRIYGSWGR